MIRDIDIPVSLCHKIIRYLIEIVLNKVKYLYSILLKIFITIYADTRIYTQHTLLYNIHTWK